MNDISLEKNFPDKTQLKQFVITKIYFQNSKAGKQFKIQKYLFLRKFNGKVFAKFLQELECGEVVFLFDAGHALDADGKVLGHEAGLDRLDASLLQGVAELGLKRN
jgi:hypothetical protein